MKRKYTNTCSVPSAWNATWHLNKTEVFNQTSVTKPICTNISALQGNWIIEETATNATGTFSKELAWTVTSSPPHKHTYCDQVFFLSVFCHSVRNTATNLRIFNVGSNHIENFRTKDILCREQRNLL